MLAKGAYRSATTPPNCLFRCAVHTRYDVHCVGQRTTVQLPRYKSHVSKPAHTRCFSVYSFQCTRMHKACTMHHAASQQRAARASLIIACTRACTKLWQGMHPIPGSTLTTALDNGDDLTLRMRSAHIHNPTFTNPNTQESVG